MADYSQYSDEELMNLAGQESSQYPLSKYSDEELRRIALQGKQSPQQESPMPQWMMDNPKLAGLYGAAKAIATPVLEAGGLVGGALLGSVAGSPGLGTVAGAGLGYAGAKELVKGMETLVGERQPQAVTQGLTEAGQNTLSGAEMEMGGQIAGKVLPLIGKVIKRGYTELAGLTTTQGAKPYIDGLKGSPAYRDAMRGNEDQMAILQKAKDAFEQVKVDRRVAYQNDLDTIMNQEGTQIEKQPLLDKINGIVKDFGITKNDKGRYVFTKDSNVDFQARSPIRRLLQQIDEFGGANSQLPPELQALKGTASLKRNPELSGLVDAETANNALTPKQADNLKQLIDDFYSPNKNSRVITTRLRGAVKDAIVEKVPQYEDMMKGYKEASQAISEIDQALSLGKGKNIDTALRKMQTMTRPINDYRMSQAERLGNLTDTNLSDSLSGLAVNPVMPRGFFGRAMAGSPFALSFIAHNPAGLAATPLFSPRVMGELSYLLGNVGRGMGKSGLTPEILSKILMLRNQLGQQ